VGGALLERLADTITRQSRVRVPVELSHQFAAVPMAADRFGGTGLNHGDGGELVGAALDVHSRPAGRAEVADVDRGVFERVVEIVDRVRVDMAGPVANVYGRTEPRDEPEDRCRLHSCSASDSFSGSGSM
jgi:hypothetical protein